MLSQLEIYNVRLLFLIERLCAAPYSRYIIIVYIDGDV
jgi:hypothetical protein